MRMEDKKHLSEILNWIIASHCYWNYEKWYHLFLTFLNN